MPSSGTAREFEAVGAKVALPMYVIEAMNGPLDGKRWPFERDITIGRDERAVQAALATDRAVSRRHAAITIEDGELVLADAQSSNGTIVGGQAIAQPVQLKVGQPFRIGSTLLRVLVVQEER